MMNKIYVFVIEFMPDSTDVIPVAISEDGHVLASHYCSHTGYIAHDMGITSDWKHDAYDAYYPGGWELEWIDPNQTNDHTGLNEAMRLNEAIYADERERGRHG